MSYLMSYDLCLMSHLMSDVICSHGFGYFKMHLSNKIIHEWRCNNLQQHIDIHHIHEYIIYYKITHETQDSIHVHNVSTSTKPLIARSSSEWRQFLYHKMKYMSMYVMSR